MGYKFNALTGKLDIDTVLSLTNPLQFKGTISVNTDFPLVADVNSGWFYTILADVTDDAGVTYTNTGQSFEIGDEIAWNGVDWTILGNENEFLRLDTSNDPLTGNLEVSKADPEIRLTDSDNNYYAYLTENDTDFELYHETKWEPEGVAFSNDSDGYGAIEAEIDAQMGNSFTISCWFKPSNSIWRSIFHSRYSFSELDQSGGNIYWRTYNVGAVVRAKTLSVGTWYHFVVTYDSTTGKQLFIDNVKSTASNTSKATYNGKWIFGGKENTFGTSDLYSKGSIDEVNVWSRVLTDAEIEELYNSGVGVYASPTKTFSSTSTSYSDDLVAIYHADETSGTIATDSSGNSNDATYIQNAQLNQAGKIIAMSNSELIKILSHDYTVNPNVKGEINFGADDTRMLINSGNLKFNHEGSEIFEIDTSGDLVFPDNYDIYFGTAKDSSIKHDGTDLIINPQKTGSGNLKIEEGSIQIEEADEGILFNGPLLNPIKILGAENRTLYIEGQNSGQSLFTKFFTQDGDGTDNILLQLFGVGTTGAETNSEKLSIGYYETGAYGSDRFAIYAGNSGTGTLNPLYLGSTTNLNQLILKTDGDIALNGKVGIGTNLPDAEIDIDGSYFDGDAQIILDREDNSSASLLRLQTGGVNEWILGTRGFNTDNNLYLYSYGTTGNVLSINNADGSISIPNDNSKLIFGSGQDASIKYDGTDLKINPREVGTGVLDVSAPIKITDVGSLLATPQSGTFEFDNDRMYVTNVATQRAIDRTSDVITSTTTVADTISESTLWTGTVDANALKVGNVIKIHGTGVFSTANASDSFDLKIKIGSTVLSTLTLTPKNETDAHWHLDSIFTVRSVGASGTISVDSHIDAGDDEIKTITETVTIDTTSNNDVTITVTWDNADAGNTISVYQGYMEFKN